MQEHKSWQINEKKKIYFSPRFTIRDITKLCGIGIDQIEEIQEQEKCNFESAHILMESEGLPFISSTVLDFFIQEAFIKTSDLQSLVAVINKIGQIKMNPEDREAFQDKMIDFRKKLVKMMKHEKQKDVLDEFLCDLKFQDLLIGHFYYAYMMKVCSKDDKKYLEKSAQNLKDCFEAAAKIFKVTFKIYEAKNKTLKLAHTVTAPSGKNFSVIYLIFHKNVFIQVNLTNPKSANISPSPSLNINGDSKNCKDWFKLARKASVNAKLQKEHPVLIPEDSVKRDSDESLFIREEEQKKIEEDLDQVPRRPGKPKQRKAKEIQKISDGAIGQEDKENFKKFLENMIVIIMSSYKKLDEKKQDEVFQELNAYFETLKKSKFDSLILRDFKKTIRASINKVLSEQSS